MSAWCTFRVADHLCGVEVERVQEVLRAIPVTRLPLAPPAIAGLLHLRGEIVPAVDLRRLLGASPAGAGGGAHIVALDRGVPVSLLADTIGDVRRVPDDALVPCPDTLRGPARALVRGTLPLDGELVLALDLDRTLDAAFATTGGKPS